MKFRDSISSGIESVMNPTIERIERELNKTFESVSEKWVKTSSVLKKLNLDLIEQRQSTFYPESLIKLYLYRRIKGIHYYEKLIEYLEKNESDAFDIGFSRSNDNKLEFPTKRAFNKFFKNKIDDVLKLQLDNISKEILRIATQKGVVI